METRDTEKIMEITENFYIELYTSQILKNPGKIVNVGSVELPEINEEDIMMALKYIKDNKAPASDRIATELIKEETEDIIG